MKCQCGYGMDEKLELVKELIKFIIKFRGIWQFAEEQKMQDYL